MQKITTHRRHQRGDTLIEVMLAFTVFALVAIGAITIMNNGVATAQRSLEVSQVRIQMDAQVDALRYIHKSYIANYPNMGTSAAAQWTKMTSTAVSGKGQSRASSFGNVTTSTCPAFTTNQRPFILNARTAVVSSVTPAVAPGINSTLPPYSQVVYNSANAITASYGIWVESVPTPSVGVKPGYVDFHIRACWVTVGQARPMTLGTIVRLYEPL